LLSGRLRKELRFAALVLLVSGAGAPSFLAAGDLEVQGPAVVGNSLSNGLGATLGRVYFRASGLDDSQIKVPLELLLSSSLVTVEPTTCSRPSDTPCGRRGTGVAGALGQPTTQAASIRRLKLASALYLPANLRAGLAGTSVEVAFEGALTTSGEARPGAAARVRLLVGAPERLLAWAQSLSTELEDRPYDNNTGAGLVLGDSRLWLFPGILDGEVVEDTGNSLVVKLTKAELEALDPGNSETAFHLEADLESALAAGLPEGAFGLIEVNYTGFPSSSRVFPGAVSNDVEIHLPAVAGSPPPFLRGDCNGDGEASGSVSDAVFLMLYLFVGGREPTCVEACDSNGDGQILGQVTDAVYLMSFSFLGGPPPPAPFPECGVPDEVQLGCAAYAPCADGG
jgi:hypothetical protein